MADFSKMGPSGLVSVLHWPFFVGLIVDAFGFTRELQRVQLRSLNLTILTVIIVLYMFGTACVIEPTASLTDSWIHAGFIQYIYAHGQPLLGYDARFSWPGAFSLGAVMTAFTGQSDPLAFLRWFPLFIELMYLAPMLTIARFSGVPRRIGWLGVAFFYAANWIYQDYFSPQGLNYLFYLVAIAAVLACLQPQRSDPTTRFFTAIQNQIDRLRVKLRLRRYVNFESNPLWPRSVTLLVCFLIALIALASAMSHQLTPYALILALGACFLTRRLSRPELVIVAALFAVGWLSLGATNYWIGHLNDIVGSVGKINSTIGSNVTKRVVGSTSHRLTVDERLLDTAILFLLAGVGVLRRRPSTRTLEALAFAPFLLVAAQSYGGEGLLRVVLFGLPFTALLAASAVMPNPAVRFRRWLPRMIPGRFGQILRRVIPCLALIGLAVLTTIVRGGNDTYESFSTGELAAVNYTYDHVHPGQVIGLVSPFLPYGYRYVGSVAVSAVAGASAGPSLSFVKAAFVKQKPGWIVLSKSQESWGVLVAGYPVGWESGVERFLLKHHYQVVKHWPTATVLEKQSRT